MKKTDRKKTNKESLIQILTGVSPGIDFSDEDILFGRILDDYNAYADLLDTESARKKSEDGLEIEYRHNTAASMTDIERMTEEESLDPEEVDLAIAELKRISSETESGHYTIANVKAMLMLFHRDADIEAARKAGEIDGRNAMIDSRLQAPGDSDGLPRLSGANNGARPRPSSIFDIALGL